MCGRYVRRSPLQHIMDLFEATLDRIGYDPPPQYNIAPTQNVVAIRQESPDQRAAVLLRWGLIPPWANDLSIGNRMINARAETVAEKPAFKHAFKRRRCLLPADGFYEWQALPGKRKQPFYIHRPDDRPLALAGLWERWESPTEIIDSCTILTTTPNAIMSPIHNRMPVLIPQEHYETWLNPTTPQETLASLLVPSHEPLTPTPVTPTVNSPTNNTPACLTPLT